LQRLQPFREQAGKFGKFPAYYRWCRGPTQRSMRRLERIGFHVDGYIGFFGHSGGVTYGPGYYDAATPLRAFHESLARWLVRHPIPSLTSYAFVILSKPHN